jgi:hypothetical protein
MSRKLMAMLVSSALALGSVSTSAWSATDTAGATQAVNTSESPKNFSPLPPGGAAGIKEAQGIENSPWLGLGIVAGIVIIAWILIDNDDDDEEEEAPSTGTN